MASVQICLPRQQQLQASPVSSAADFKSAAVFDEISKQMETVRYTYILNKSNHANVPLRLWTENLLLNTSPLKNYYMYSCMIAFPIII